MIESLNSIAVTTVYRVFNLKEGNIMSIETVRKRCIENTPDIDIEGLDKDIQKQIQRFEKIVKTSFNESQDRYIWEIIRSECQTPTEAKNANFDKHKLDHIHNHLTMLIDLFDYKPEGK